MNKREQHVFFKFMIIINNSQYVKYFCFYFIESVFIHINRVVAKKRKGMRNFAFFISHLARRNFFEKFFFSHEKKSRKNKFLSTKKSKISDFLRKEKKFSSHFSLQEKNYFNFPSPMGKGKFFWGISLPACGKGRDCLPISLSNDHPAHKFMNVFTFFRLLFETILIIQYFEFVFKNYY